MDRKRISLHGNWTIALDVNNVGLYEGWFQTRFEQEIHLPGSLDEASYGELVTTTDPLRLNRNHKYVGIAWYNRSVELPEDISEKHVSLVLERCMWKTEVWINGKYVGSEDSLCVPHHYILDGYLLPGENIISIKVDNAPQYDLGIMSHGYSDEVQTIWNGIIGRIELIIQEPISIDGIQIYPNPKEQKARVKIDFANKTKAYLKGVLDIQLMDNNQQVIQEYTRSIELNSRYMKSFEEDIFFDEQMQWWDEFEPHLYVLNARLSYLVNDVARIDSKAVTFGMREFEVNGPVFVMNGKTVYLRGTHDAGNFPLTGYPSMEVEDWIRIYKIAKTYGINHFRFHSWCPPEAAFDAADRVGIILQAELPLFGYTATPIGEDVNRDTFLERELYRILKTYGNHPSFCMMCMGNELRGDYSLLEKFVEIGKAQDGRHLYASAANNAAESSVGIKPNKGDQYYIAHEGRLLGKRVMRRCEMIFNHERPETMSDYRDTLIDIPVPTVSHEVGQWEIYPNYAEIQKYTGVLKARNLEVFQASMASQTLSHQAINFLYASGKLSVLLYKEEIERSLRTPNYGGFQLLDMHDFPGQGTAHVGWLDTFWDSKDLVDPDTFRNCCHHTVVLSRIEKRVWVSDEIFKATIEIANYSTQDYLNLEVHWSMTEDNGTILGQGQLLIEKVEQGSLTTLGQIVASLITIEKATKCILNVELNKYSISNQWEIWVYPALLEPEVPQEIYVATCLDEVAESKLMKGESVLLLAQDTVSMELMCFTPPFWNTQLFDNQRKTMGIFCDASHPIFSDFPTDDYTNWQWWELLADSKCVKLNGLPEAFEPIVWAIDHPVRNLKMGVIFEAIVNSGKLLVCSLDLINNLKQRFVARQLLQSIILYMESDTFSPQQVLKEEDVKKLLAVNKETQLQIFTKHIEASNSKWSCSIENVLTSDPGVFWVTFSGQYPYTIDIELYESVGMSGFKLLPRQDGMKVGFISDYEIYVSNHKEDMGNPTAKGSLKDTMEEQTILFDLMDDGFNVTRRKSGKFIRFVAINGHDQDKEAAIAMLDLITV